MHVTTLCMLPFIQHDCYMHATCMLQNLNGEQKQLRQPDNFHIASLSPIYRGVTSPTTLSLMPMLLQNSLKYD